ncbi:uncharacterized protein LOC131158654 [Malania oleifera]|uniref:uncharacterized protein LOC131158654 n=1 Tax=Malania oleifera TaxID=397392 RepID=UPI0025AE3FDE|nr:uncharacterized protein LOC131158654 [Malania oleifera]
MANSLSSSASATILPFISQEELHQFHTIDRKLYTLLVTILSRNPFESLQIMALWLWLERADLNNVIVKKMLSLPHTLVNGLADEAVTFLISIASSDSMMTSPIEIHDMPLTQSLMKREMPPKFFHEHREQVAQGIAKIFNEVCLRVLADIMQQVMQRDKTSFINNMKQPMDVASPLPAAASFQYQSLGLQFQPGFSTQVGFGRGMGLDQSGISSDDRTMFVTFSKGYPVFEWEIREFFTRTYGNCIESLHMQEVMPNEQALFARIVFSSAPTLDVILHGMSKVKFTINGKHVWARKFVPKHSNLVSSSSSTRS